VQHAYCTALFQQQLKINEESIGILSLQVDWKQRPYNKTKALQ